MSKISYGEQACHVHSLMFFRLCLCFVSCHSVTDGKHTNFMKTIYEEVLRFVFCIGINDILIGSDNKTGDGGIHSSLYWIKRINVILHLHTGNRRCVCLSNCIYTETLVKSAWKEKNM